MSTTNPYQLAVFISGTGSNMQAIHRAILDGVLTHADLALVFSQKPQAQGLEYAREHHIPTLCLAPHDFDSPEAFDHALFSELQARQIDYIALAGYLKILTPILTTPYAGKITNIHPSLLPAYGGTHMFGNRVHASVLANAEKYTGCTVHMVTDEVDSGPILGQSRVEVLPDDTVESLARRVLREEHALYPLVLERFMLGQLEAVAS
ncbi:MAG: phosphoribosylglycinamide formyltransferase [Vampirovibrio sp.]